MLFVVIGPEHPKLTVEASGLAELPQDLPVGSGLLLEPLADHRHDGYCSSANRLKIHPSGFEPKLKAS